MSALIIGGEVIHPGERRQLALTVAKLYDFTDMKMPVEVVRGREDGPTLFISAAIHGDEINGVDIVRRLLKHRALRSIRGTLIAIPIVNVFGFNDKSRYLPDRRDLNRSFPGAAQGSLASQVAHIFRTEIVNQCTHGIDLHTGAIHRRNFPQIRTDTSSAECMRLAHAFGAPVILDSSTRDGSLREMVDGKIPMLLYEAGTALRFDHQASMLGVDGILNVMRTIGMLPPATSNSKNIHPFIAKSSQWVRAPISGIFITRKKLGEHVEKGDKLGFITNPFGDYEYAILAPKSGLIIGNSILPLANEGDGLYHIAAIEKNKAGKEEELYPYIDPDLQ